VPSLGKAAGARTPKPAGQDLDPTCRQRPKRDRNFIEPLARGLAVLQAFTPADQWLGNLEVSARVGLPSATVNRLLKSLMRLGYLSYSPQQRQYQLAAAVLSLGYSAVASSTGRNQLRWHMQALADSANAFVMLGQRDRLEIVLLEVFHSNSSMVTLRLEQGARIPIAGTAMGWALMAALPDEEREYLLTHIKRTNEEQWPLLEHKIQRGFSQFKSNGYCVSLGAWRSEITTAAIPLVPANRSVALVLGCASASPYMPMSRISREIGPNLASLAKKMGEEMPNYDI
jgi:DNA-binding IclR family transcriptional regulator